jgi:hypothetical protein
MSPPLALRCSVDAAYLRLLRKAVQLAGSEVLLASALGVPLEKLATWLSGESVLPVDFYMAALDIVQAKGSK